MLRASGPTAEAGTGGARAAPTSDKPEVIVHRPDAGIARGVWEAPPWAFAAMALFVGAALALYVAHRRGKLKLPWLSSKAKGGGDAPK